MIEVNKPFYSVIFVLLLIACNSEKKPIDAKKEATNTKVETSSVELIQFGQQLEDTSLKFEIEVPSTGRYRLSISGSDCDSCKVWVEDYIHNKDDRTYDITGRLYPIDGSTFVDGSPLAAGKHPMRLHVEGAFRIDELRFELIQAELQTRNFLKQNMSGDEWKLVWSDEFEGTGLPDSNKWSYNIGNWGWGNNEPQYYTNARVENARQENGNLIIEARKNDMGEEWTSARITTAGKVSFTYGKIEFRAKVPEGRGTWAAGWLLGDAYQDELSWPYCGEIDVLECVGYEIDDKTGSGLNHATCHTRSYYFKQGNQIGAEIAVDSMNTKFHVYAIEWDKDGIHAFLDGEKYYTYDKTANELEWPFNQPQNIILNLAVGGGWGGLKGIDQSYERHQYIIDYVRVYERI